MSRGGSVPQTTASIVPQGSLPTQVQGMNPAAAKPVAVQPVANAYDNGMALMNAKQYDQAEMAFRQFLTANPRSPNVSNAHYWLGESYLKRNRFTDAAEQYLTIYQSYPKASIAPDALVKLAVSLRGMGQKAQACATLGEVGRKYPNASSEVRAAVGREQKRAAC